MACVWGVGGALAVKRVEVMSVVPVQYVGGSRAGRTLALARALEGARCDVSTRHVFAARGGLIAAVPCDLWDRLAVVYREF